LNRSRRRKPADPVSSPDGSADSRRRLRILLVAAGVRRRTSAQGKRSAALGKRNGPAYL